MAITKKNAKTVPAAAEYKKADAFLNLKLVAADGQEYNLPTGLALHIDKLVSRSIINAAKANPDRVFTLTGTVYVPAEEGKEDIAF